MNPFSVLLLFWTDFTNFHLFFCPGAEQQREAPWQVGLWPLLGDSHCCHVPTNTFCIMSGEGVHIYPNRSFYATLIIIYHYQF